MADSYDYILTRNEIIESAFSKIGELSIGQNLTSGQLENGVRNLNALVQDWQNDKIFLWDIYDIELATAEDTASYVIDSDIPVLYLDRAYIEQEGGEALPLELVKLEDITQATERSTGEPSKIAYEVTTSKVFLYPTPDKEYNLTLYVATRAKDWVDSASNFLPERFQMALIYGLAALLADDASLPVAEREVLIQKAIIYFSKIKRVERERVDYTAIRSAY